MKIHKTDTEYNMKSIRFLLLTITTMFIFISCLMIVLGISIYSRYHDFSFLYESAKNGGFFTPSVMIVILGIIMLVVTSFGFFGSLKESTCMVNLYALILFLVLIVELAVVIVAFTMDPSEVKRYINIPVQYYTTDSEIQIEIDYLQRTLNCCGSTSYLDFEGQEFNDNHLTVTATYNMELITLPQSCCFQASYGYCTGIRHNTCTNAIVHMIVQNTSVLGVLGVSVLFIQLLGIIFALLLARCIRKLKSERGLRIWNERERAILERIAKQQPKEVADKRKVQWVDAQGSSQA